MDANLKAKWIEALRSGKYEQTTGKLHDCNGFCCLGVLCDISGAGKWVKHYFSDASWEYRIEGGSRAYRYLSPELRNANQLYDSALSPLMDMNDGGRSFADIADYIEKNL